MYSELIHISKLPGEPRVRYTRMLGLLRRICLEQSEDFKGDYATLFSRLLAVCQVLGTDHRPADRFRRNARLVLQGEYFPSPGEERADLADLCHFVMQVTGQPVPDGLPQHIRPLRPKSVNEKPCTCQRGVVTDILGKLAFKCRLDGMEYECKVEFFEEKKASETARQTTVYFYKGANVMLLDVQPKEGEADTLVVFMAVLEPDYLIDVSALTSAIKPYGVSPLNFLLDQLSPNLSTKHTLLGNLANQFMDDCVNGEDSEKLKCISLKKNYQQYILDYACLDDKEIDSDFFEKADLQYLNIRNAVKEKFPGKDIGLKRDEILLEPSFICPTLGLRGRLDVMDERNGRVLELKSGKCKELFHKPKGPKEDHLLQMSLYREILRRNFGGDWNTLQSYLFYSSYPLFYNERPSAVAIRDALSLRNGIINLVHCLTHGKFEKLLPFLTPEHLHSAIVSEIFFEKFLRPQIENVTKPLQLLRSDELVRDYFSSFLTFIERELFLKKTSDNRPDSIRGFAATWTADIHTKLMAGNLLTRLTISELERDEEGAVTVVHFNIPNYDSEFVPNFNTGEMVQLYEAHDAKANVTNQLLIRGTVAQISAKSLSVELAFKQRNPHIFTKEKTFAAEHDMSDKPATQQLRNLFSLLTATPARRDLLLARRSPETNPSRTLCGTYPAAVNDIVLRAKQSCDYFILVGPPGTGKTDIALRSMVHEFLLTREKEGGSGYGSLLLTAYTNRAVDEICSMLEKLAKGISFDYLRIGAKQTCGEPYRAHLLSERAVSYPNRTKARAMIDRIPIVVGTVITLTNNQLLFRRKQFAAAIFDEASQLLEPQALGLLCAKRGNENAIKKFILIGDHKQLPAVVMLPEKQTRVESRLLKKIGLTNLRNSLFERLHKVAGRTDTAALVGMLDHTGRMHPDICHFVSHHFYEDNLKPVPLPHQKESLSWKNAEGAFERFVAVTRIGFVNVVPQNFPENLRANAPEAEMVCRITEAICSLNWKKGTPDFSPSTAIGVIVPFRSQIASVRGMLRQRGHQWADAMTIDTVECYQGSQRDYIIFSTTISEPYQLDILSSLQEVAGCHVDRKLNVALTRARLQLFIIGNRAILERSPIYRALIRECNVFQE